MWTGGRPRVLETAKDNPPHDILVSMGICWRDIMLKRKTKHIEISQRPELLRLADEVGRGDGLVVLTRDGEELLEVRSARFAKVPARKRRRTGVLTHDDPLWRLVGSATEAEPSDASRKYI